MNLSMDTSQEGLDMFFKDYQVKALKALWKSDEGFSASINNNESHLNHY